MSWKAEIVGLHDFFSEWFSGRAPLEKFATLENALESDFTIVVPGGSIHTAHDTLEMVRRAHGRSETRIDTKKHELVADGQELVVARYEEWHNDERGRVSTVVFRKRDAGLGWLTVQETWL